MPIQVQGNSGVVSDVDGTTFRAQKVTSRPTEYGAFGHYRLATTIGLVVTQAANGTLLSFRWADASRLCVVNRVRLECLQTAAATATIWPTFSVFIARSFSASDTSGTALTLTGNSFKKKTSMGTTLLTDARISAAAAGVSAGTRTLDANPIMTLNTTQIITTPGAISYMKEYSVQGAGDHPIVLATNEGLIVQGPSTIFGAAGTANLIVEIEWAEVSAY